MARRCGLTSLSRIFLIIPIWIVLGTVSGGAWEWAGGHSIPAWPTRALAAVATLVIRGWVKEVDRAQVDRVFSGADPFDDSDMLDEHSPAEQRADVNSSKEPAAAH